MTQNPNITSEKKPGTQRSPQGSDFTLWLCQQFAIENDHSKIVDFPMKNGGSFHSKLLVYQRVIIEASWPQINHGPIFWSIIK